MMQKLTIQDYLSRVEEMQNRLKAEELDAVIIASDEAEPANVRYFTNYWPVFETCAILIPKEGEAILLIGPETVALVQQHSVMQNYRKLIEFRESSDPEYPDIPHSTFKEVFKEVGGLKRLGLIGTNVMTVQVYQGIVEALPGVEFVKADNLLRQMRMVKTSKEISIMKKAAEIVQKGFEYALNRVKPGMTEIQAAAECIYGVLSQGAEAPGFMVWCVSGQNTNQAIGMSSHKVIEKGEIVQFTMGAMYEGYVSSFGRPFVFGKPSDHIMKMLKVGLEAHHLTYDLVKPGADAATIARTVHDYIRKQGFGEYIVYGPAHGTGMMECEFPFVEATSDYRLQENMTFAIDTFLGGPKYGMRYEDTAAVSKEGIIKMAPDFNEIIIL